MKLSQMNHYRINREFRRAQKEEYQDRDIRPAVIVFLSIITAIVIGVL